MAKGVPDIKGITRVNCHWQKPDIYCGREWKGYPASALGNPFRVGDDRHSAVGRYRFWLWDRIRFQDKPEVLEALIQIVNHLQQYGTVTLGCWCHENYQCHTDIIALAVVCPDVLKRLNKYQASKPHDRRIANPQLAS